VNGDGVDDILIGANRAEPNLQLSNAGETYVHFGKRSGFDPVLNLSTLNGTNGFVITGIAAGDYSGRSVSRAGDVNGDGFDDIPIGAYGVDVDGVYGIGKSYVVFGNCSGFGPTLNLGALYCTDCFVIKVIYLYSFVVYSVSGAGDVNCDGFADILIGAVGAQPAVEAYVVFGNRSGFGATLDLSTLDCTNGFVIRGIDSGDSSGYSVSGAGDMNCDGYANIIISGYGRC
jgi:hypothetical protein